jgi:polynucleotide 5'-kinase involved in rRNA processing
VWGVISVAERTSVVELDGGVIIIEGPAGVEVESGEAEVLGRALAPGQSIIVPVGRSLPLRVKGRVRVRGEAVREASLEAYRALEEAARRIAGLGGRVIIMGPTDSGKSTIAAWVSSLTGKPLLTVDVGQNEYYAPGFEALVYPQEGEPLIPGSSAILQARCFVGSFSPSRSLDRYLACASRLSRLAGSELVVDTDGWISGFGAAEAKASLAEAVGADAIAFIGVPEHVRRPIVALAGAREVVVLQKPPVSAKSREERRAHRERLVALRLMGAREVLVHASRTPLLGSPIFRCPPSSSENIGLGGGIVYLEKCDDRIVAVFRRKPRHAPRGVMVLEEGWEEGLLAAVIGDDGDHHIAVVEKINYRRALLVLKSQYHGPVRGAILGSTRITVKLGW